MNGKFLSSFLKKSGKNVPLLRTAQAAKNNLHFPYTTDFIRRSNIDRPYRISTGIIFYS